MPTPYPTQLSGALFLANRERALLADEPRVGKTGTSIIATDYLLAEKTLDITTASGRGVWMRGYRDWSAFGAEAQVLEGKRGLDPKTPRCVVGWANVSNPNIRTELIRRKWDVIKLDESHYAKNFEAKRTQAVYGKLEQGGKWLANNGAITSFAPVVWHLTGTPMPNSPADLYPMLRSQFPSCLKAHNGMPDVLLHEDYMRRYCIVRMKKISNFNSIPVVIGGRNEEELRFRIGDYMLRRTQADVGIRPPVYETLPLTVSAAARREIDGNADAKAILMAAEAGTTRDLETHLGPLMRLTGSIAARAIVEWVREEFDCGLDKIVLAYWHKEVGAILAEGLSQFGVVGIDGATKATDRTHAEDRFRNDPSARVFLAQIQASGEAVDLSAAAQLVFVEPSFIPKDMKQMALRITNHTQTRQCLVRVAALQGSIHEAVQEALLRKWTSIKEVLAA